MTDKIILIGGGGHAKACIDVIEQNGSFEIAGIVDLPSKTGETVLGYNIMATDDSLESLATSYKYFLITLGQLKTSSRRIELYNRVRNCGGILPSIVSPLAYISKHSSIGNGTIVMHHAVINASVTVGANCIINTKALLEHDAVIGDNCHISTNAVVNGGVIIGSRTFVGSNAVTKQYITIPEDSFIQSGSMETGK